MDRPPAERDFLDWLLRQPAVCPGKLQRRRPDFLVVSPPKTGSTWLAANLRAHPELYVPPIKEVKYFSCFWRWLDLNWYLDHFAEGEGRVKGEASPSYAILPPEQIRLVRELLPDVKLVFLLREPLGRAWSHARHNHQYREVNFAGCTDPLDAVALERWRENFRHDWALASGDYLGQLRHWMSVFPRRQVFVDFYERVGGDPEGLLRDVFAFLGVSPGVDLSAFPVTERILAGQPGRLRPALKADLHRLHHRRTVELAGYLRERFGLEPPPEWQEALTPPAEPGPGADFAALDFARAVRLEESFPSAARGVLAGHRGYEVVCHHGRLFAVSQALGAVRVDDWDEATRRGHQEAGRCFVAPSLAEVTRLVDEHLSARDEARLRDLEGERRALSAALDETRHQLSDARDRLRRLEVGVGEVIAALNEAREELARVSSFRYWAGRAWRSARRRVFPNPVDA